MSVAGIDRNTLPVLRRHHGRFEVGHGNLVGALRANPVVVLGAFVLVAMPAIAAGMARQAAPPSMLTRRTIAVSLVLVVLFSEIWQLIRFGIV